MSVLKKIKKPRVLTLVVTEEWFDKIFEGNKPLDYRRMTPFWKSRIAGREYDFVEVINGYGKARPRMTFDWRGCSIVSGTYSDLKINESVYAIDLSSFVEYDNIEVGCGERIATEDYACSAYDWVESGALDDAELDFGEKRLLVKTRKAKGKIKKGDVYVKYRVTGCGERCVYRALPFTHKLNSDNDVYREAC